MYHHQIDIHPIPQEYKPRFINEPWLIDRSLKDGMHPSSDPDSAQDNIRIYVPLDLNRTAILRRLNRLIYHYGEANEANEFEFSGDVDQLVFQIEIYDQIWYVRHMPKTGSHSQEAIELVRQFIAVLEEIPDGCAECFPFELIDRLRKEYGIPSK